MLPPELPLFPLPSVVLFPDVSLPLHIFEPRYRAMVGDALASDRMIGMVLLRPGWEPDYEGRPPVYPVGCAGLITHAERLPDGRFDIILQGLQKFSIEHEDADRPYRRAHVQPLQDEAGAPERAAIRAARRRLEALVTPLVEGSGGEAAIPQSIPDVELINALAQYLPLEPVEKQALLERHGALARCESLIELLEMKAILQTKCATSKFCT